MAIKEQTARAGKTLGRYRIERELGRGGMGIVYLAIDENLGRRVALKTTNIASIGSSEQARSQRQARFNREVKALTQVNHENVVHVFDSGEADDHEMGWLLYYTMQFVDGITLAQLVHRMGALDAGAAASVCMQVASGLGAGHQVGIIHRDVKPANIFIDKAGRALIGDFGICKLEGSTQITRRDQLVGTPNYLAPEQILGDAITPGTDVFALGALFFVVTTNRPLRDRVDPASLLAEAQTNEPRDKMLAQTQLPNDVRKVVARALERDPKQRYADCTQFAEALSEFATRIPRFEQATLENMTRPGSAPLDSGTGSFAPLREQNDDTPFEDALGTAHPAPFEFAGSGAAGVEEAALALLKDAGINESEEKASENPAPATSKKARDQKAKREDKKKPSSASKAFDPSLPVAETESTVMFNMRTAPPPSAKGSPRASDDDAALLNPKPGSPGDLPVARAESTVMFNLRQMEEEHAPSSASAPRPENPFATSAAASKKSVAQDSPSLNARPSLGEVNPALSELTSAIDDDDTPRAALAREEVLAQPALKKVSASAIARPPRKPIRLSPTAWMAIAGVGGVVVAAFMLVMLRAALGSDGPHPPPKAVVAAPAAKQRSVPPLCKDKPVAKKKAMDTSVAATEKARKALQARDTNASMLHVEKALAADGRNAAAYFVYALNLANLERFDEAYAAYQCVVHLDPSSPDADSADRAILQYEQSKR